MDINELPMDEENIQPEVIAEDKPVHENPTSAPAILIRIFCLQFALSEKAMKALLELFKLNLDV